MLISMSYVSQEINVLSLISGIEYTAEAANQVSYGFNAVEKIFYPYENANISAEVEPILIDGEAVWTR